MLQIPHQVNKMRGTLTPNAVEAAGTDADIIHGQDLNNSDLFVQNQIDQKALIAVAQQFGISRILKIRNPLHYSATSKKVVVDTTEGSYFIKQKASYASDDNALKLSGEFQNFLALHIPDVVPHLIKALDHKTYVHYGSRRYVAMPEVHANSFMGRPLQVSDAGRILACIHNLSEEFTRMHNARLPKFRDSRDEALQFVNLAKDISKKTDDPARDIALQALYEIIRTCSSTANSRIRKIIVHGDYTPSNLLFQENMVAAVLDFDNVAYHARVRDLAEAILTFGGGMNYIGASSNLRSPIATNVQFDLAKRFLDSYQKHLQLPLSQTERNRIPSEILLSWVEHMGLGIIRGDFGFKSIIDAWSFVSNIRLLRELF